MQIMIDLNEKKYHRILEGTYCGILDAELYNAIKNGTQLPKGHGRLFDEKDIVNGNYQIIGNRIYELEPIIEADKE